MNVIDCIKDALKEDIQSGDVTTQLLLPNERQVRASITAKAHGVFFGKPIIHEMQQLYPSIQFNLNINDGDKVSPGDECLTLSGDIRIIVQIERTLLNFLQRLSGVASITRQFVDALGDTSIQILDTRKTTPLLRQLEKQAVLAGGGFNHRHGLYDMVLVKENHLISYIDDYGIEAFNETIRQFKSNQPTMHIEVEVGNLMLLKTLDLTLIDIVMFDNMTMTDLDQCIQWVNSIEKRPLKEVSGGINLDTIKQYRGIDIDRISVGSLTHSVQALDLSLLVK
ncbi:MAG: carboxylating nicotinate-nucleotide diphosphorylase [Candidatus Marinamargulisbacteria bacterium]